MPNTHEVELKLTQKELLILHNALLEYKYKLGDLIDQLGGMWLSTDEAQELSNQMRRLSDRMCDLMVE